MSDGGYMPGPLTYIVSVPNTPFRPLINAPFRRSLFEVSLATVT